MVIIDSTIWAVYHLGAWGMMLLCAAGLGRLLLRRVSFQNRCEALVFTIAFGLGSCAFVLFILGLCGLFYRPVIWALTVSGSVMTALSFLFSHGLLVRRAGLYLHVQEWKALISLENTIKLFLICLVLVYWILLLILTQYPPVQWDAIAHHLIIAREYLVQHHPVVVAGIPQPVLPALNHTLFTWALALSDDVLAQMVEHSFLMLTALGLYAWGKRQNRPALGVASAALWLAHPIVLWLAASAYIDVGVTCFVFLGIYALRIFWDTTDRAAWYLAIGLLAMGASVKLPGFFFVGIASLLGLWVLVRTRLRFRKSAGQNISEDSAQAQPRFNWRSLVLGWGLAILIPIPWYGFITYHTGNPLWPAFAQYSTGIWGAPWVYSSANAWLTSGYKDATLSKFLMLSVDWIRYPERFYGELNLTLFPPIMIWPLAWLVAVFNRAVRGWALWALAYTVFWFLQVHQLRYWLPVLPIAGLA